MLKRRQRRSVDLSRSWSEGAEGEVACATTERPGGRHICSSAVMFTLVVPFMLQPAAILSHLTYDIVIVTRFTLSMYDAALAD